MAALEATSLAWFVNFMKLPCDGLVPTVTPTEYMPNRTQLAEFFGPKIGSGYTFDAHDNLGYELYVRDLYERVYQAPWLVSGVVPFHFARGLLAEAMHMDVNWSEFAFKLQHPHQAPDRPPRILEQFVGLSSPLAPLVKTLPHARSTPDLLTVNAVIHTDTRTARAAAVRSARADPTPTANPATPSVKVESTVQNFRSSLDRTGRTWAGFPVVGAGAYAGLSTLRNQFAAIVEAEIVKLKQNREDSRGDMEKCTARFNEEKDRLKFVQRKVQEKADSYNRAIEEHERAQDVVTASHMHAMGTTSTDIAYASVPVMKICEKLVNSLNDNKESCLHRLKSWEYKCRRQTAMAKKVQSELEAAEALYADTVMSIDMDIENLQALSKLLQEV